MTEEQFNALAAWIEAARVYACRSGSITNTSENMQEALEKLREAKVSAREILVPSPRIGEHLQVARKSLNMTLHAVAREIGVSKPTVWAWEKGRAQPTAKHLVALKNLFRTLTGDGQ